MSAQETPTQPATTKSKGCGTSCCGGTSIVTSANSTDVQQVVRDTYAQAARNFADPNSSAAAAAAVPKGVDPITRDLYSTSEISSIPHDAFLASLGCGNPTALAALTPGQVVLDLGSGGGIDVLLSAKRVSPGGKAYGLDMTPEMLALARENQRKAGVENVEFLEGKIEEIPLPDGSVDVIISNCVINLAQDKDVVLKEAARVLKAGGQFAVSDIVLTRPLPEEMRKSVELWAGCVAGALLVTEYEEKLKRAGFTEISVEPTRVYEGKDMVEMASGTPSSCCSSGGDAQVAAVDGAAMSAFIRARKGKELVS